MRLNKAEKRSSSVTPLCDLLQFRDPRLRLTSPWYKHLVLVGITCKMILLIHADGLHWVETGSSDAFRAVTRPPCDSCDSALDWLIRVMLGGLFPQRSLILAMLMIQLRP
jgi:hypothetical protein